MTTTHYFDNWHHHHRPSSSTSQADRFHPRHRPSTSNVPSRIDGLKRRNESSIKSHSSIAVGLSSPPLIHPSRHSTPSTPINNGPSKVHSPYPFPSEHPQSQSTKAQEPCQNLDQSDAMAPKLTRAAAKAKELQEEDTPLLNCLKNIKNAKVQEGPF